ncbi:MAG: 4Fe-4S dicluster domain-containing protein [Verrucomicrobiota bacterium]
MLSKGRKLESTPWSSSKIARRAIKHGIYILISLLLAHLFVSYFVSIPRLYQFMQQSPSEHARAFGVMLFLTIALYFSFSWFREQFCIILCPYGRIQSALTDDDTVIIGYDKNRGEPRGRRGAADTGDCIDCLRCVKVCPTGIDIRNGLQLECIGCAACIDACNTIMDKVEQPRGLIRYDSLNGLEGKKRRIWRPRLALYTGMLCLGLFVFLYAVSGLRSAKMEIIRMAGQPYYLDEDSVRNQFRVNFVTKKSEPVEYQISVSGLSEGAIAMGLDEPVILMPGEKTTRTLIIQVPKNAYQGEFKATIKAEVSPGDFTLSSSVDFIGPSAYTLSSSEPASNSN